MREKPNIILSGRKTLGKSYAVIIFLIIYVAPMFFLLFKSNKVLSGDIYVIEKAYIINLSQLTEHLYQNIYLYCDVSKNPIFIFFVSAVVVQKLMKWIQKLD